MISSFYLVRRLSSLPSASRSALHLRQFSTPNSTEEQREEMKAQLLQNEFTEYMPNFTDKIIARGRLNNDKAKNEEPLSDEDIEFIRQDMIKDGVKEYELMRITPYAASKAKIFRRLLFSINVPTQLMMGYILFSGNVDLGPKRALAEAFLYVADFALFANSYLIYVTIRNLVTVINYLPEEHKVEIKKMSSALMDE